MLLAQLVGQVLLSRVVIESADVCLVATGTVTFDPLVLVWMVQTLYRRVAL